MASKRLYKGSPCTKDCGGHRAGARYARSGGTTPSKSPSFNKGMRIAQGGAARRSTRR
tara:strand:- start:514 stop:687 length:174 start_codon:yes stop_codon:yes gene_type:complete